MTVLDNAGGVGNEPADPSATSALGIIAGLASAPQRWVLEYADDDPALQGPDGNPLYIFNGFGPDSVRLRYEEGTVVVATKGPEPAVNTQPGQPVSVEVTSTFRAPTLLQDLQPVIDRFEAMRTHVPSLGRKPRVTFSWGSTVVSGYIRSLDLEPSPRRWLNGNLVWLVARFVVVRERDLEAEFVTPSTPEPSTSHVILGHDETYEMAAYKLLGNPSLGPIVRAYNPQVLGEEGGSEIIVLPRDHSLHRRRWSLYSSPFVSGWEDTLQAHAELLRGGVTRWDALSEALTGDE